MKQRHKEQDLQIRCVKYFRYSYPELAVLLEHPKNEVASGNRTEGAIAKAEGVQAGVADLILHVPSELHVVDGVPQEEPLIVHSLAIEMKTKTGRQSPEQKIFQRYFEAAGNKYVIVRSFEEFTSIVNSYVFGIPYVTRQKLRDLWLQIDKERTKAAREEMKKLLNK